MAFQERIQQLATKPATFWGQGYRIRIDQDDPSLNWNEINIPVSMESSNDQDLVCLLLHEWGHRCIAPVTVATGYWWQILAKMEGVRFSAHATNMAADLLVDRWYMTHPEWADTYTPYIQSSINKILPTFSELNELHGFHIACYIEMQQWHQEFTGFKIGHDFAKKAVAALMDSSEPLTARIRGFMKVLGQYAKKIPYDKTYVLEHSKGGKGSWGLAEPIHGQKAPWRNNRFNVEELIRLIKSGAIHVPSQIIEDVCGQRIARQTIARLRVLESLSRVMHKVNRFVQNRQTEKREGNTLWRVGDPINRLQTLASLEKTGYLLPGVNTLRRRYFNDKETQPNFPTLILIVDNSSSTTGQILLHLLDAVVSIIEVARKYRGKVSLIVFGNEVDAEFEPGWEYDEMEYCLAGLSGQSGGTNLRPPLSRTLEFTQRGNDNFSILIFTDSYISDIDSCIPALHKLKSEGEVIFFCVENILDGEFVNALEKTAEPPRLVRFRTGQPLVDQTLEILIQL